MLTCKLCVFIFIYIYIYCWNISVSILAQVLIYLICSRASHQSTFSDMYSDIQVLTSVVATPVVDDSMLQLGSRAVRSRKKRLALDRECLSLCSFAPYVFDHQLTQFYADAVNLACQLGELDLVDLSLPIDSLRMLLDSLPAPPLAMEICEALLPPFELSMSYTAPTCEAVDEDIVGEACAALSALCAEFVAFHDEYRNGILTLHWDCVGSLEFDGIPILDEDGHFIEWELFLFDDLLCECRSRTHAGVIRGW